MQSTITTTLWRFSTLLTSTRQSRTCSKRTTSLLWTMKRLMSSTSLHRSESACPEWQQETQAIHPKWLEHHQSGHLTKGKNCPVCIEEPGSRRSRYREGVQVITHLCSNAEEGLCVCTSSHQRSPYSLSRPQSASNTGSWIVRIHVDGGGEFNNQKLRDLCFDKHIILSFSPAHQPSSNGIAERMVGMLKITVRRMLKQAHLEREWWSYACKFAGRMMREKILGRPWQDPLFGQLVGIWRAHDRDQIKSLDDRGAVCYLLNIDIWHSGATRVMQDGIVVKGLAPKPLDPLRYHINPRTDLSKLEEGMP